MRALPEKVGRFVIEAHLGSGGMGDVYRALDPTLRRTVAIKTVRPDIDSPDGTLLDRLYREAQAVARLQHPNIVTVFEAAEADGLVYIAMEYLKGESLAAANQRGDLSFENKFKIVSQILEALQYAHGEGIIHRDIKPANVHLLPSGSIKLLDFGLAHVARAESLTATGLAMGTPFYASPEQLKGEDVDGRTDIYATGVLTYELLTGRRAFDGETLTAVMLKVLTDPPPPMGTALSAAFPELDRILARAMAKDRADRFSTADDMRNALAAFMAGARDGLASVQAMQAITAQKVVLEAKTLIESGRIEQAEALLVETLRANPEAVAVRALLKDTTGIRRARSVPPTSAKTTHAAMEPTVLLPPTVPAAPRPVAAPGPAAAPSPAASSPAAPTVVVAQTAAPSALEPAPAPPARPWLWAGIAAAVAIVAVAAWALTGNRTSPATPPAAAETAPAPSLPPATPPPAQAGTAPSVAAPPAGAGVTPAERPAASTRGGAPPAAPAVPAPEAKPGASAPAAVEAAGAAAANASAKKMYADSASHALGLKYGILRQTPDGGEGEVDPAGTTFHSGDKIRFTFESNGDGYLYLVQEGSSGKWTVLFPNPDINGGINAVKRLQKYTIPSRGWFVFNEIPGVDRAFVFLSREPLDQLPGFNQPVTRMESVASSIVENLRRSVRARDLLFEREQVAGSNSGKSASTFVVNRDELGRSVAASIELLHQQ